VAEKLEALAVFKVHQNKHPIVMEVVARQLSYENGWSMK
jgi:hypothetical protein